jgi:hypothetical protein
LSIAEVVSFRRDAWVVQKDLKVAQPDGSLPRPFLPAGVIADEQNILIRRKGLTGAARHIVVADIKDGTEKGTVRH